MAAADALAVHDAESLLTHAQIGAALSFEALLGLTAAYDPPSRSQAVSPASARSPPDCSSWSAAAGW